ncbi:NAD(P)-dependent alcohol dehydrogenase [Acidiplasma sp.]|uniref:NAD(P)-dependent alcohol dehydrogenase n=1 Tax=Acidiplasma sp. TaxID=1872114 RepID=UPI00258A30FA|nr:NAD(P)-dependent alcohol dehydrogenase [Acidiplasma sp.]
MKAFVMKKIDETGFMDKPVPECGPYDAIIKTTHALICTSDTHTLHGAIGERHNLTMGHEAVGTVYKIGDHVKSFRPGDRVIVGAITPDWGSLAAQMGHPSQSNSPLGGWKYANTKDGSLAEYFHVNDADANMAKIPDNVKDEAAVYAADMMSTGFMGAENAHIPLGGDVAIFGGGPVGLMAVAGSRMLGAGSIILVETVPARIELGKYYGADNIVDFKKEDAVRSIMGFTGNNGVDSSIEALGSPVTFANAINVTKPGGTISNVGYHSHGDSVPIPRDGWGYGMAEKTITTGLCTGGRLRMERLMKILENKRIDPTKLTTHRFKFDDADRAFEMMDKKTDNVIKPLITF